MELGNKEIIEIFKSNFNCQIKSTPLGLGFQLSTYDAFVFCSVTGSGYLDNPIMPFTPKGLMKLFYNAFQFNFVTGIFDNANLKNTPYQLSLVRPYLFEGDYKIVVPIEFNSDMELQEYLFDKFETIIHPTQYIILRVETSKKGNGLEPLLEYFASRYFSNQGYICENQIPLSHTLGSPDFGSYGFPDFMKQLSGFNIFNNGFNVIELAMLRFNSSKSNSKNYFGLNLIVGEAKTSTKIMEKQLSKYLSSSLFDLGIEIHPDKNSPTKESFGLLSFDSELSLIYKSPKSSVSHSDLSQQTEYREWLMQYFKLYLIANLSNDEFQNFYKSQKMNSIKNCNDISNFVQSITVDIILDKLHELKLI